METETAKSIVSFVWKDYIKKGIVADPFKFITAAIIQPLIPNAHRQKCIIRFFNPRRPETPKTGIEMPQNARFRCLEIILNSNAIDVGSIKQLASEIMHSFGQKALRQK